jgi:hypothetical protein
MFTELAFGDSDLIVCHEALNFGQCHLGAVCIRCCWVKLALSHNLSSVLRFYGTWLAHTHTDTHTHTQLVFAR